MIDPVQPLKVFFCCTGVGRVNRGIESFFREAFDGLRHVEGLTATLWKGAGQELADEHVLPSVSRTGVRAKVLGRCIRRSSYVAEQLTALPSLVRAIRRERPHIIFYCDASIGFQLYRWRKRIGVNYRLLFSNGGPCRPPFTRTDFVHQVAPFYFDEAVAAGVPSRMQSMVPYGIHVSPSARLWTVDEKRATRQRLGLPVVSKIVLSVGWVSSIHKRMDYVINEIAALPEPRPHLVLLGHMDAQSREIVALAHRILGPAGFTARSVPYNEVDSYYNAADAFTLASLAEGFGRVFLEALMYGLPCIVHDHPVMRFVLGSAGTYADLSRPFSLTTALQALLVRPLDIDDRRMRWEYVRSHFDWAVLASAYYKMFHSCIAAASVDLNVY